MAEAVRWRSHPIVGEYPRSLLCPAIVLAICVGVYYSFESLGWALLSAGFFAVSLARYFLPTSYELNADGVRVSFFFTVKSIRWSSVRRVDGHRQGLHLSPFERPSLLDSFRGTFLRFRDNADEVVSFVESKVGTGCRVRTARQDDIRG